MEETHQKDSGAINLWESAMTPKTGAFEWNESLKTVVFKKFDDTKADKYKSKFQDRVTQVKRERNDQEYQKQILKLIAEMRSKAATTYSGGDPSTRPITFLDCKAVALNEMIANRQSIPDTFLEFFLQSVSHAHCVHCIPPELVQQTALHRTDYDSVPPFDQLVASLAVYFDYFFTKKDADESAADDMHVSRSQAEEQMLIEVGLKMKQAAKQFGVVYNTMILGLGMDQLHHMNRGKCRVSATLTDRQMFEALYTFSVEFIWITFGRRDREEVKREVGRLFRSDSFNRALRTTSTPSKKMEEEELDTTNIDPKKLVMTKDGRVLKDTQILAIVDRMGNRIGVQRGPVNEKAATRSRKEASARSRKSTQTSSTKLSVKGGRSKSTEFNDTDEEVRPTIAKPPQKKRSQLELETPLTDEQILACFDRLASRYEDSIKLASKEHQKQRIAMKRPPKKSLMEQRSVAGESVIPSVKPPGGDRAAIKKEEANPFIKMPERPDSTKLGRYINVRKLMLGIIGQPLINYNSSSLIPLVNVASQQQGSSQGNNGAGGPLLNIQPGAADSFRYFRGKVIQEAAAPHQTPPTRETTIAMDYDEEK